MPKLAAIIVLALALLTGCSDSTTPAPSQNYIASKSSAVFHRADCRYAARIHTEKAVWYSTRDQAIAGGHRPCKVCNP